MKIVSVDCMIIDSGNPCKGRNTWNPVIIRINTDEGISGFGEVGVAYGKGFRAGFGMIQDFAEVILGENPMNSERPLMYHGMVPFAAKKDCILLPFWEKANPTKTTPRENSTIVMMSRVVISNDLVNKTGLKNI